ncbi:MAG TPA: polymer-forming cytoskeletal protein [Cytophagaceae bacterium]|jgi:cytoskeletal protein CcmA (bactofilin family)|nr:polymer-forming cytoskeletal protein [Cytophagaceae bacterium]
MFKKDTTKKELEQLSNSSTIIGKGTVLEGDIETLGNLRIEGKAIGNIKSKSKIALGDSSIVEGNIIAQNAEIAGEVKGTLEVSDLLILKSGSVIHGDIITNRIIIESGASFNGQCKMGAVKEIIIGERNREEREKERSA